MCGGGTDIVEWHGEAEVKVVCWWAVTRAVSREIERELGYFLFSLAVRV